MPGLRPYRRPTLAKLLTRNGALPDFMAILEGLWGEGIEGEVVTAAFFDAPNFPQIFSESGLGGPGRRGADLAQGLRDCFGLYHAWPAHRSDECAFGRWQLVMRNLETLRPMVEGPAFYSWAVGGAELLQTFRPRIQLWDSRVARAVSSGIDQEVGVVWADELPHTIAEFLSLRGIGPSTVLRIERELIRALLQPELYAPTAAEMLSPGFAQRPLQIVG